MIMNYVFQPIAFVLFMIIVGVTLGISFWAAKRVKTSSHYYVAGGGIKWLMNGIAFAGDYLSAASFLGIAGLIAFSGFDGFMYSIGFLAGWVVALLLVAEPLRRLGKYTFGDALVSTFKSKRIRLAAAVSTLIVSIFYLIPQIVGAGSIVQPLLGLPYEVGVVLVGALVILIVATAGMVSTTYVQFIKGLLLLLAALGLTIGVLIVAGKGPLSFIGSILESKNVVLPSGNIVTGETFLSPGLKYKNPLDFASLAMGLILGTAALPHILIRYYTVPTPGDARKSTVVAIGAIGMFYVLTLFLGLGANYFKTYDPTNQNLSAPLLANFIGGEIFFAFISSIAFATILGTVAGLIMAAAGAIAHDIYTEYLGKAQSDAATLKMSKMTAVGVGILAILLGIVAKGQNVAFLVGLAFAIAASANLPALLCTIYWKGAKEKGIVAGIWTGLLSSILLISLSPTVMGASAIFPLENPGLVSIPLGLAATVLLSLGSKK
jgi:cation/acetate symporter